MKTIVKYFLGGKVVSEVYTVDENSMKQGLYEDYYSDGKIRNRITYKDNKRNGPSEFYFRNGQLADRTNFKDNKEDGLHEVYFEKGLLAAKATYKNGELEGPYEEYYGDGSLSVVGIYKDGELIPNPDKRAEIEARIDRKEVNEKLGNLNKQLKKSALRGAAMKAIAKEFREKYPEKNAGRKPRKRSGNEGM